MAQGQKRVNHMNRYHYSRSGIASRDISSYLNETKVNETKVNIYTAIKSYDITILKFCTRFKT